MKTLKRLFAKALTWALKDEVVGIGSVRIIHPHTMYTDDLTENTPGAGTRLTKAYAETGTTFPLTPKAGQFFYKYTATVADGYLYVYIGVGRTGTTNGWFNLSQALYAA